MKNGRFSNLGRKRVGIFEKTLEIEEVTRELARQKEKA
jgi:hypothetical protein